MTQLPPGWTEVALGDVALVDRATVTAAEIADGTLYVGLEDIEAGGAEVRSHPVESGQLASNKFRFDRSHILYGKLRPYLAKIAAAPVEGICSTDILPIRPTGVDQRYLLHFLRQPAMVEHATSRSSGANLPRLAPKELERFGVPLPPLEEQRRIAAILDKADELRAKRRAASEQLDSLAQAIFLDMFGDPISGLNRDNSVPLQELGSLDRGVSRHRPRNDPDLLGGPYPLVQTGDVARSGGYISTAPDTYSEKGLAQSKLWPAGTLCITIAANIARTGILTFDACFPDSVVGFLSDRPGMPEYVQAVLSFHRQRLAGC